MRSLVISLFVIWAVSASAQHASSTATGISNTMNPAISVNGLFWGQVSADRSESEFNRIALQEAEAQFTSIVDPFWKANLVAAVHPSHHHEDAIDTETETTSEEQEGLSLDLEEAYLDGRFLPAGLALRLGKFYLPFGKHASLHTHQFPFAEAPVAVSGFLGDHGLTDTGAMVTASVPLPWFSDLQIYCVDGGAEIFEAADRDLAFGARLSNLWDVSAEATVEVSGSFLRGPGVVDRHQDLSFLGIDLTYKWISSTRSKGPALTLTGEFISPDLAGRKEELRGWYALAQYRFHRDWWLGATHGRLRGDVSNRSEGEKSASSARSAHQIVQAHDVLFAGDVREYKLNITFAPSEFSALRMEVAYFDDRIENAADELRFMLQWNFTIGSHPAHLY